MKPGVSVIICCYNSAARLPETLRHLALQEVPSDIPWEIIVVNNASTDNTVEVAAHEWANYNLSIPFRIVEQPKPGLSNARDKGFEVAAYGYCLFCDDDNWLQNDYVRIAFETMESDPMIGTAGGQGEAVMGIEPPPWFRSNKEAYAVGPQAKESGYVTSTKGVVYGAGLVIRKEVYGNLKKNKVNFLLTDRMGTRVTSGNDSELCYITILLGYQIYYRSELKFYHFIPQERLTKEYLQKLYSGFRSARIILSLYHYNIYKPKVFNKRFLWYREIFYSFKNEIARGQLKFPYTFELFKRKEEFSYAYEQIKLINRLNQKL